jgi:hypothetical protein
MILIIGNIASPSISLVVEARDHNVEVSFEVNTVTECCADGF